MTPYQQNPYVPASGSLGGNSQKPSVCRSLHFYKYNGATTPHQGPWAAIVTFVHPDNTVNVRVWDVVGNSFVMHHVSVLGSSDVVPAGDFCVWPPCS